MSDEYLSIKTSRKLLGVTTITLRRWAEKDKIRFVETPTGRKLYNKQDVYNILGISETTTIKKKIAYCRVSSSKQRDDLERQKEFFKCNHPEFSVVEDIGSGINWNRKGLQTLLEQVMLGEISEVMVAYRDRLCRFAFELIEFIFRKNNVKLIVLNTNSKESGIDNELSEDIMSIIHVYNYGKIGRRRYSKKSEILNEIKEVEDLSEQITTLGI